MSGHQIDRSSCSSNYYASTIYFDLTEGATYYIAIIGQNGKVGSFGVYIADSISGCDDSASPLPANGSLPSGLMRMALKPPSVVVVMAETYLVKAPGTHLLVQVKELLSQHAWQTLFWTLMWLSTAPREANAVISLA